MNRIDDRLNLRSMSAPSGSGHSREGSGFEPISEIAHHFMSRTRRRPTKKLGL